MLVPTEFHSTLCRTYHTLWISVRQPITEVKAEWNVAADVWEIENRSEVQTPGGWNKMNFNYVYN